MGPEQPSTSINEPSSCVRLEGRLKHWEGGNTREGCRGQRDVGNIWFPLTSRANNLHLVPNCCPLWDTSQWKDYLRSNYNATPRLSLWFHVIRPYIMSHQSDALARFLKTVSNVNILFCFVLPIGRAVHCHVQTATFTTPLLVHLSKEKKKKSFSAGYRWVSLLKIIYDISNIILTTCNL